MSLLTLQNFYKETIAVACTAGATNIYVSTKPTPSEGYLVISAGTESLREIIKYTATGTDGTGDYVTVTLANRGLGGTTDQSHEVGETVRMNYTAGHYTDIQTELNLKIDSTYLDTDDTLAADSDTKIPTQQAVKGYVDTGLATKVATTGAETIAGVKTFSSSPVVPAPTTDLQAATKKYADDLAIAGSPDASATVKGLVEEATQAEFDAGTDVGATGAKLFVPPSVLNTRLGVNCRVKTTGGALTITPTPVNFDAEDFDTNSIHDNVTNNTRLTIPVGLGGLYMIGGDLQLLNTNPSELDIRLNGATLIGKSGGSGTSGDGGVCVTTIYELADSDYVELLASSSNTITTARFWLVRLI